MSISFDPMPVSDILKLNQKSRVSDDDRGLISSTIRYFNTSGGSYRMCQALEKWPSFFNDILGSFAVPRFSYADALSSRVSGVAAWMGTIPRFFDLLWNTTLTPVYPDSEPVAKDGSPVALAKAAHYGRKRFVDNMEAAALACYSASLFLNVVPGSSWVGLVKQAADMSVLCSSLQNITLTVSNLLLGRERESQLEEISKKDDLTEKKDLKEVIQHTRVSDMLLVAKDVAGVIVGSCGLVAAWTGVALLSGFTLAGLSCASTALAIGRSVFDEMYKYKPVDYVLKWPNAVAIKTA